MVKSGYRPAGDSARFNKVGGAPEISDGGQFGPAPGAGLGPQRGLNTV